MGQNDPMKRQHHNDIQKVFDSHFHIIDKRFPLVADDGYLPDDFSCNAYLERIQGFELIGGAVVSASFQAFDQTFLLAALDKLGPNFVGVTQLPSSVSDEDVLALDACGVRAVRFNLERGGSERIENLESLANRIHELAGWHVELYVDSTRLSEIFYILCRLPMVSIDHLGLSKSGFNILLKLVERGVHIKATGFGRVDLDVRQAIKEICLVNPDALMFGTDLPGTRTKRPFSDADLALIDGSIDEGLMEKILFKNAVSLYRPRTISL